MIVWRYGRKGWDIILFSFWDFYLYIFMFMIFYTVWKVSKIRSFIWSIFPAFGLNAERYEISLRIQPECEKIRTKKNSVFGHISQSANDLKLKPVSEKKTQKIKSKKQNFGAFFLTFSDFWNFWRFRKKFSISWRNDFEQFPILSWLQSFFLNI